MDSKAFWTSKTFWVNLIAIAAIAAQAITGNEVFNVEAQATLLAVVNLILRIVTKQPISWS